MKWVALGFILWVVCFFWVLGVLEDSDRAYQAKQTQMSAALEKITEQCLTGKGVTDAGRLEACNLLGGLK